MSVSQTFPYPHLEHFTELLSPEGVEDPITAEALRAIHQSARRAPVLGSSTERSCLERAAEGRKAATICLAVGIGLTITGCSIFLAINPSP